MKHVQERTIKLSRFSVTWQREANWQWITSLGKRKGRGLCLCTSFGLEYLRLGLTRTDALTGCWSVLNWNQWLEPRKLKWCKVLSREILVNFIVSVFILAIQSDVIMILLLLLHLFMVSSLLSTHMGSGHFKLAFPLLELATLGRIGFSGQCSMPVLNYRWDK